MAYSSYRGCYKKSRDPNDATTTRAYERNDQRNDNPAQASGAAVEAECSSAAGWNGTPEVGRLPLGLGAPVDDNAPGGRWRACKRRQFGPRSPMTPADHELAARAWLRARPEARARSPWRWIARWVRDAAAARSDGAAMRASPLWPVVLATACRKQPTPIVTLRWFAETCSRSVSVRRRDLRAVAERVLRLVSLAGDRRVAEGADGVAGAVRAAAAGASDATRATLAMLGKGALRAKRVRRRAAVLPG